MDDAAPVGVPDQDHHADSQNFGALLPSSRPSVLPTRPGGRVLSSPPRRHVWLRKPPLDTVGSAPDVRFSYANERTFLAWNRTALAMVAAGLAVTQLLPPLEIEGGRQILGVPLITLGAVIAYSSYRRWEANERALRLRQPLPPSRLPRVLAAGIALSAVIAGFLAAFGPEGGG